MITDYFSNLFTSSASSCDFSILDHVTRHVDGDMRQILEANFRKEDVITTLKQMHPTKVPGLDGMALLFYQKY